ncbi:esterase-like activity of phytase family protein [Roseibacterium sp. SDUM158016]|uniref:esterase-like activity of phytase family protein n=1 Tax=Roseicyclus sediminis TaxID=2980997 RepID=UPI0021CEAF9B|nr:esterase-like activity of phytase family protein [Roseibacterium sp. SDUM158016]MCU4651270.1 esterase-like activity of phytase family protein [Roseibacterium sp. SDUM158016]
MTPRFVTLTSALALLAGPALAQDMNFNRIASFMVGQNAPEAEESSAEIIAVTEDGMTLVYTDSPAGVVGFIDITDPANPTALGAIAMPEGEPTSVAVRGMTAYVGENTSPSFTEPSGVLHAIDVANRSVSASCDLGGQPDAVAIAPDGSFIAVAIENERDEDAGDGRVPQMPAGFVAIIPLSAGDMDCDGMIRADVTGLADIAPEDPEPEFVSINGEGEIVVTLQENNHIIVLASDGSVLDHFSAGEVALTGIDTEEEGALTFDSELTWPREPDSVAWIDDTHFAIANEGDMDGGTRGWTIFSQDGEVVYESGTSFEYAIVEIGHYPEERSGNKGVEPESITVGTFGGTPMIFVGAERASIVGVYDATDLANPVLRQLLPSGIGPEGYVTIPSRNLLVSANETDLGEDGLARAHVMIFEYQEAPAVYPHLTSAGMDELTGWAAISGQVMADDGTIYAVSDSFLGMQPTIYHIDVSQTPARIVDAIRVTREGQPAQLLDMEGIALDGDGGFWIASEGRSDRLVPHAIYHVGADGAIEDYIALPNELLAVEIRFGFEGITRVGDMLYLAVQRPWRDDPANHAKVLGYNLETEEWSVIHYPLTEPATGWVGLSEIVAHGDWVYFVERDNQVGENAVTKLITRVPLAAMEGMVALGETPAVLEPEVVVDLLPYLTSTGGYVLDKVEGLAIAPDGTMWVSTDNDGVDDHSGETMFFAISPM